MGGFRRVLAGVVGAMALTVAAASPADATVRRQVTIDRWDYSAWGSGHTVLSANHLVVHRFDAYGNGWYVIDHYLPFFCQVSAFLPGNAQGTPLRIRIAPPIGSGLACLSNAYHGTLGWSTGTGYAEGQNYWASACVEQYTIVIPLRDPNSLSSYGTEIAVC